MHIYNFFRFQSNCFTGHISYAHYPKFLLAVHSSKKLSLETVAAPHFALADSIIRLALEKGQRHPVRLVEARQICNDFFFRAVSA